MHRAKPTLVPPSEYLWIIIIATLILLRGFLTIIC